MFRWYKESQVCYAFLGDVKRAPTPAELFDDGASIVNRIRESRWLTRARDDRIALGVEVWEESRSREPDALKAEIISGDTWTFQHHRTTNNKIRVM